MRILHPHHDVPPVDAYVPVDPDRVGWGWIPAAAGGDPVAVVPTGATLAVDTLSHEGVLPDQGRDPVAFFGGYGVHAADVLTDAVALAASDRSHDPAVDGPHILTGPVVVDGAVAGTLVAIHVRSLELRVPYGLVSQRPGHGLLDAGLEDRPEGSGGCRSWIGWSRGPVGQLRGEAAQRVSYPVRPFLGITAVGSAQAVHSRRPGAFGGNLDARVLGVGTTLWLPVRHDGAWLSFGDPHHAQGDGEIAGTAVEGSLRATVSLSVRDDDLARWWVEQMDRPLGATATHLVVPGFGDTLDDAARAAVDAAVNLVAWAGGLARDLAYSAVSAGADLHITQAVNGVCGAHVLVPRSMCR